MAKQKPKVEYRVMYRGNADHPEIYDGMHASRIITLTEAQRLLKIGDEFFNVQKSIQYHETGKIVTKQVQGDDGVLRAKPDLKIERIDKVDLWIEKWMDGELVSTGDPEACQEPSQPTSEEDSDSSSPEKKSRKKNSSESTQREPALSA